MPHDNCDSNIPNVTIKDYNEIIHDYEILNKFIKNNVRTTKNIFYKLSSFLNRQIKTT